MPSTHTSLSYHIVFSTKHRERSIIPQHRERLYDFLGGCLRTAGGVALEIGGTSDHVHLLAGLRATHCLADVLRDVKRATSLWVHDTIGMRAFGWQEGYGAFTVSPKDCRDVIRYIQGQDEHHRTTTFEEEYVRLLKQYGIDFDERYLW